MISPFALFRALLVALFAAALAFAPAHAGETHFTIIEEWVEGDDGESFDVGDWVEDGESAEEEAGPTRRYAPATPLADAGRHAAQFGPFRVVDAATVRMAGDVDSATPRQFAAMLAAHPGLKRLELVDCPGSLDEDANLVLARAIRRARLETIVPSGGSVRSGAVELWLAGVTRRAAPDAEFGVHSWIDENGMEAGDYPADDPVHAEYLGYYREMGLDAAQARAFYTLTNSTPFDEVRYLTRDDMAQFVTLN